MTNAQRFLDKVKFDKEGLVPAIAQDSETGKVLMLAYMNRESLEITLNEGKMCYWSRSRKELWRKGATSGNWQEVQEILIDCDGDALVFKVKQTGGACHEGYDSCFFRKVEGDGSFRIVGETTFDAEEVYRRK